MRILFVIFAISISQCTFANEILIGLSGKLKGIRGVTYTNGLGKTELQDQVFTAIGLQLNYITDNGLMIQNTVHLSRAKYMVNYQDNSSQFLDADIRFTEWDIHLCALLNKTGTYRPYIGLGPELLFRRWGEERYINSIIPGTYWPNLRVSAQAVAGLLMGNPGEKWLNVYAGLNLNPNKNLPYDTFINQVFLGLSVGKSIEFKRNKRASRKKCFNF